MPDRPNILLVMTDEQQAYATAREGFPLDTSPFLDSLARQGVWFDKAYCPTPLCMPSRISTLTGRWPSATGNPFNGDCSEVRYHRDVYDVLREAGYATAMFGKNHSHLTPERCDDWFCVDHCHYRGGTPKPTPEDLQLEGLRHYASLEPTPFPIQRQFPYRIVSKTIDWIDRVGGS